MTHEGHFRTRGAYLHTRPARRPPIYVSAFHPGAAQVAGRLGDGLWTMGDPEMAPDMIDAYRGAAEDAGREAGEIVLHAGFSWAPDDEAAPAGADVWRATLVPDYFTDDWHDPRAMQERAQREVSDEALRQSYIIFSDPEEHVERVRQVEALGATIVVLMNVSGSAPMEAIEVYGRSVLPALRGARVGR